MFAYLYLYSLSNCNRPEVTSFKGCHFINVCPFIYIYSIIHINIRRETHTTIDKLLHFVFRSNIIHACLRQVHMHLTYTTLYLCLKHACMMLLRNTKWSSLVGTGNFGIYFGKQMNGQHVKQIKRKHTL